MKQIRVLTALALLPLFGSFVVSQMDLNADALSLVTTRVTVTVWTEGPKPTDEPEEELDEQEQDMDEQEQAMDDIEDILDTEEDTDKVPVIGFTEKKETKPTKAFKPTRPHVTKTASVPFQSVKPVAKIDSCKTPGDIALTYNEGPTDATLKIAEQLSQSDARVNFFVNSTWLSIPKYATVLQDLYRTGHLIGMSYRVKNDNPNSMTDNVLLADMVESARKIQKIIGVAPKYVRVHGSSDARVGKLLSSLGFVTIGYNLDSGDYLPKKATGPDSIQEYYKKALSKSPKGSFIAIHYDMPQSSSVNAVGSIVSAIEEAGYSMVRLDGCLKDPNPYKKFAESPIFVHDPFSFKQPQYHKGQKIVPVDTELSIDHGNKAVIPPHRTGSAGNRIKVSFFLFFIALLL
ncbi:unnamed protein product [Rhizopus stolonifer]